MRELRKERGLSQEDMVLFGFSGKHWQQLEAGRPITVTTLLRICETLGITLDVLLKGLDQGVYDKKVATTTPATIKTISERRRKKFSS